MKSLNEIKIDPHPAAEIFKRHGVSNARVARALGLSYPYVCSLLSGTYKANEKTDAALTALARELEA